MEDFAMPLREIVKRRAHFQPAPDAPAEAALPLVEKQAIVDEVLRGMPLRQFECYTQPSPNGTMYYVTKGWVRMQALLDFVDNKFPTWNDVDKKKWERGH